MQVRTRNRAGLPRYLEIANAIRRDIARNQWGTGQKIPPIKALAERFGVAPMTAREAVKHLESRGVLACRSGSGTYVAGPLLELQSLCLRSDLSEVAGQIGSFEDLEIEESAETLSIPQGLTAAQSYKRFCRLFRINGQPLLVSETHLDASLYRASRKAFDAEPILPTLFGLSAGAVARASQVITIELADYKLADALNIAPHSPVAALRLALKDQNCVAVYLGVLYFPAELVRIEFDV
jgi:GntR family transcriptional regulator